MIDRSRIDRLLEQLLELPATERAAALARETKNEAERLLLERMLAASEESTRPELGASLWRSMAAEVKAEGLAAGTELGAYRIVSELGRGGMAVVYLAERADQQFEQQVALKILQRPASDELAVRRFHLERQILASLEHPNIARLFDGGIASDGRPYFVMERVEGLPIDRYCDEHQLTVAQRLRLFAAVGKAVAAAHRQLVVHRDLKPSNILVSKDGVPKLLDFGIAKLVEGNEGEQPSPALTRTAMLVLTPEYASPEQRAGRPVTTASDVYQLGLLLFELLSGVRAFRFAGSTPGALAEPQSVREPTRPSTAVVMQDTAPDGPARARARGLSSLAQLKKVLVGDLDTLVLAAMRPEAERRYESASALVADVERWLDGRPILARRPSLAYRSSRFVKRHRWAVGAAAAGVLALLAGTVYHSQRLARERDRAELEAAKAGKVAEFLVEVFKSPNPRSGKKAVATTALEVAERGAKRLQEELDDQPEVKAALLHNLGRVFFQLYDYERSASLLDEALALERRHLGDDAPETLQTLAEKANLLYMKDEVDAAQQLNEQVLAGRERRFGKEHPQVASCLLQISQLEVRRGNFQAAYDAGARALAIAEKQAERQAVANSDLLWRGHQAVAMAAGNLGRSTEALRHHQATAQLLRAWDPEHPQLGQVLSQLANHLWFEGQLEAARPVFAEAVEVMTKIHGADSSRTAVVMLQSASAEVEAGNGAGALKLIDAALVPLERDLVPGHIWIGNAHNYRGYALSRLGHPNEALMELEKARLILLPSVGGSRTEVLQGDAERCQVLLALGRRAEATELAKDLRQRLAAAEVPQQYQTDISRTLSGLGL